MTIVPQDRHLPHPQPIEPPANSNHPTPHPTESLPPALRTIRRSFELLSISYFLSIFGPILAIQNFSISKLEADLDGSQPDSYIPTLIPKLLVALTGDRTTNLTNWESRLRREFLRRDPHANPLGEQPLKSKPKVPKRAVGYVYVTEPIPLSTLPTIEHLNLRRAQLDQPQIPHNPQTHSPPSHRSIDSPNYQAPPQSHIENAPLKPRSTISSPNPFDSHDLLDQSSLNNLPHQSSSLLPSPDLRSLEPIPSAKIPPSELIEPRSSIIPSSENSCHTSSPGSLGTISWSSLPPRTKLQILYKLCEWHFNTPHDLERFRRLVDTKVYSASVSGLDERFDWRQERCGIDSSGNQYWLCGLGIESRLWIQRPEPEPPRKAITLRIPARTKNNPKLQPTKGRKRKTPDEPSSTTQSISKSRRPRQSNNGTLSTPKPPRLSATRSSTRLRATQADSTNSSTSPRPPTMIVIKASSLAPKPETPSVTKRPPSGLKRPTPRRRGVQEVWQDVPPGWLEEVVQPTSKFNPPVFSSDLSDMSDDDDDDDDDQDQDQVSDQVPSQVNRKNSKPVPKPSPREEKSTSEVLATSPLSDGSLTELTESRDASTVVTCESVLNDSDIQNGLDRSEEHDEILDTSGGLQSPNAQLPQLRAGKLDQEDGGVANSEEISTGPVVEDPSLAVTKFSDPPDHQSPSEPASVANQVTFDNLSHPHESKPISTSETPRKGETITGIHQVVPKTELETLRLVPDDSPPSPSNILDTPFPELKGHPLDPEWIEWEVICSNLDEWKNFSLRFHNTESQSEKQLVDYISQEVLPVVIAAFHAEEARIQKEEALAQRKRSSRIATREAAQVATMEAEMITRETRMHSDRLEAKRLKEIEMEEARKQSEEDQRLLRLKEREERATQREAQLALDKEAEHNRAERARLRAESKLLGKAIKVARPGAENCVPSIDSTQPWKLDCEICGVVGINMDDGSEVICCDKCEKWQHLVCHDRADQVLQRPKRDWATADFMCSNCSGIPIPRVVKRLRTHVDGKPKPKPRSRVSKASQDQLSNPNSNPSGSPTSATKPKITILMSNPNTVGGTSLSTVSPDLGIINTYTPQPNRTRSEHLDPSFSENPKTNGSNSPIPNSSPVIPTSTPTMNQSPVIPMTANSTPSSISNLQSTNTMSINVPDLTMYYDDFDKLCSILRSNVNLYRSLPIDVMHRLRRYLLEQQQQRREQHQPQPQQQQSFNNKNASNGCGSVTTSTRSDLIHKPIVSLASSDSNNINLQTIEESNSRHHHKNDTIDSSLTIGRTNKDNPVTAQVTDNFQRSKLFAEPNDSKDPRS